MAQPLLYLIFAKLETYEETEVENAVVWGRMTLAVYGVDVSLIRGGGAEQEASRKIVEDMDAWSSESGRDIRNKLVSQKLALTS